MRDPLHQGVGDGLGRVDGRHVRDQLLGLLDRLVGRRQLVVGHFEPPANRVGLEGVEFGVGLVELRLEVAVGLVRLRELVGEGSDIVGVLRVDELLQGVQVLLVLGSELTLGRGQVGLEAGDLAPESLDLGLEGRVGVVGEGRAALQEGGHGVGHTLGGNRAGDLVGLTQGVLEENEGAVHGLVGGGLLGSGVRFGGSLGGGLRRPVGGVLAGLGTGEHAVEPALGGGHCGSFVRAYCGGLPQPIRCLCAISLVSIGWHIPLCIKQGSIGHPTLCIYEKRPNRKELHG